MRRLPVTAAVAALVAASLGALASCTSTPSPAAGARSPASTALAANAVVRSVTDGDTINVSLGDQHEAVRLIGIDTPEVKDPDKPVECYGEAASTYTKQLLPKGTAVRLERDAEARDKYGRLLAYVYRAGDGLFVNLELARQGYANVLSIPPNIAHAAGLPGGGRRRQAPERRPVGRLLGLRRPSRRLAPWLPGSVAAGMATLAERLGHRADARLVIISCDDLGACHASNVGVYDALRDGVATSASLMVPAPWAREAAARVPRRGRRRAPHPERRARAVPLGPGDAAPSLLDGEGGFPRTVEDLWDHADLEEVRRECRAQIERALVWGFDVTHLAPTSRRSRCGRSSSTSTSSWPSSSAPHPAAVELERARCRVPVPAAGRRGGRRVPRPLRPTTAGRQPRPGRAGGAGAAAGCHGDPRAAGDRHARGPGDVTERPSVDRRLRARGGRPATCARCWTGPGRC